MATKARKSTGSQRPIFVSREVQTDPVVILDAQKNNKSTTVTNSSHHLSRDSGFDSEMSFQSFLNNSANNNSANNASANNSTSQISGPIRFPPRTASRRKLPSDHERSFHDRVLPKSPPRKRLSLANSLKTPSFSPRSSASIPVKGANKVKNDAVQPLRTTPLRIDTSEKKESPDKFRRDTNPNKTVHGAVYHGQRQRSDINPMMSAGPVPLFASHPSNFGYPYLAPYSSTPHGYIASYTPPRYGFFGAGPPSAQQSAHRQFNNFPPMTPVGVRNLPHYQMPMAVPPRAKF